MDINEMRKKYREKKKEGSANRIDSDGLSDNNSSETEDPLPLMDWAGSSEYLYSGNQPIEKGSFPASDWPGSSEYVK